MFCLNHHSIQLKIPAVGGLLAAMVCVSCDGAPSDSSGLKPVLPVEQIAGFERGTISISGRVTLKGEPNNPDSKVKVGGDDYCKSHGDIFTERWKVASDDGFQDVVVTVVNAPGTPLPDERLSIVQENCVYKPHVSAMSVGQSALIENADQTFHNVRIVSHKRGTLNGGSSIENYGQPTKGSRHVHRFDRAGIYRLECDVHRWMRAWVFVHSNNHVSVTGLDGRYEIPYGLRDGVYKIAAHHHQFANPIIKEVTVIDGRADVDFEFVADQALK